ncbi:GGDEF domain-containing protein [Roseobacter sp. CCS2]|uniref:GGDEF domain-containing protein n=1 Tax=Roseobacter sp. CCS2 TaxID=391593 RepID=UPI0000F40658|nr:diguanylate cyclase [Roseobacter sp. CCS2]EBA11497.1 Response regulator containing a CheY-like receiver domain and a GGDEF domain [Roseobacter sp. CCS2]
MQMGHTRRIYAALIGSSGIAIVAIFGVLFWMTYVTNAVARDESLYRMNTGLKSYFENLREDAAFFAHWTVGYEVLVEDDPATVESRVGVAVTVDQQFSQMYITDPDGVPRYAYASGIPGSDLSIVNPQVVEIARAELDKLLPDLQATHAGLARIDGALVMILAARTQPLEGTSPEPSIFDDADLTQADMPLTILTQVAQDDIIKDFRVYTQVDALSLYDPSATIPPDRTVASLSDVRGNPIVTLAWQAPRPADQPLRQVLPTVAGISLLLIATALIIARATAQQTIALSQARQTARTDHLTGLFNRQGLDEIIASAAVKEALARGHLAALYLDLNGFKALNDAEGHEAGDIALQLTADRLNQSVRSSDYLARLGGDEFLCLLIDEKPRHAARFVVTRILELTSRPIQIENRSYDVLPSIGVAFADGTLSWEEVMNFADTAMYVAKSKQTTEPVFYSPNMQRPTRQHKPLRIVEQQTG